MPRVAPLCLCLCLALAWPLGTGLAEPGLARARNGALRPPAGERAILQAAELALRRGDPDAAVRSLAHALKRAPTPRIALRYAELTLPLSPSKNPRELARRHKAAQRLLALLADPGFFAGEWSHQLGFHAAWAHAQLGALDQSLSLLERISAYNPARGLPYLRALAALALPQQERMAEQSLLLARALAPGENSLLGELGLLWLGQGQAHRALPLLAERFAREPSALSSRRDYAYALSAVGRPAEAFALLGVAREACRETSLCLLELARFALEARAYTAALQDLDELRARAPNELSALFLEADVRLALGEPAQARALYQRIIAIAPDNLRARAALLGLGDSPAGGQALPVEARGSAREQNKPSAPPSGDAATTRP